MVLFVGVNGSGKTTTLGKIAADLKGRGAKVLIAAGDTFRAAAIEQLKVWARARRRAGRFASGRSARTPRVWPMTPMSPGARRTAVDVLLIDTAGRSTEQVRP